MKKVLLIIVSLIISIAGLSQDSTSNQWKLYPSKADSVMAKDTIKTMNRSSVPGSVVIEKDDRINKVSDELAGGASKRPVIKGYRIQIISSSTKSKVDSEKGRFVMKRTGESAYTDYKAPNFKLLVGNFRTRLDAEKFQNEIKDQFPNTIIISHEIELPKLD